jgi:hypothetical protein
MDKKFILTVLVLDELQKMGYNEVWIGKVENPHWTHKIDNFLICAPPREISNWPALWALSESVFGKQSCGNGLKNADQAQRPEFRNMISGHYKFSDKWEKLDV